MRITINEILELDTVNSKLVTDAWFHLSWRDELLSWDPADYMQLKQIHLNPNEIWKPDIVLINSADQDNLIDLFVDSNVVVNSTGDVSWITMGLVHSKCPIWFYDFPNTNVKPITCTMTFCSLIYQSHEVNITTPGNEFFLAGPWTINPKIALINVTGERYEKYFESYGKYSFEALTLKLRRRANVLPLLIQVPTLTSITMILCMFFLPVTWPVRLHLGLCAILIQLLLVMFIGLQLGFNPLGLARSVANLRDDLFLSSVALVMTLIFRRLLVLADSMPQIPYVISSILEGPMAKFLCFGINESEYKQHTYSHNLLTATNDQHPIPSYKSQSSIIGQPRNGSGSFSIDHVALINEDCDPVDLNGQQSSGSTINTNSHLDNNNQTTTGLNGTSTTRINMGTDHHTSSSPTIKVPLISHSQKDWMLLIVFADRIMFVFYALIMVPRLLL